MQTTIKQLAEKHKVQYAEAAGLMKFLSATGKATEKGTEEKAPGTKGKGATIWEIPDKLEMDLAS
jgi:hypothetical protein